jgi:hypothetical protein
MGGAQGVTARVDRKMKYHFWQHKETEEVFAVRMDEQGKITGGSGPLQTSSIQNTFLAQFVYFKCIGEFIANNSDEYRPYEVACGKMKEKSNKIICSGCGAKIRDKDPLDELSYGICDVCLKRIRGEELEFSAHAPEGQELPPFSARKN